MYSFPGDSLIKTLSTNEGDMGSIPGLGKSLGEGMATLPSILAWETLASYSPWVPRVRHDLATKYKYKVMCTSGLPLLPMRFKL